jgi:hypothetical protein
MTLFAAADHPLVDEIRKTDVDNLTPLAALTLLRKWQESLGRDANREGGA